MQKAEAPKAPKAPKEEPKPVVEQKQEKATVNNPLPMTNDPSAELAAVAYALYLAQHSSHDIPTAMISLHKHATAWNEKSVGMNNVGF